MKKRIAVLVAAAVLLCAAPLADITAFKLTETGFNRLLPFANAAEVVASGICGETDEEKGLDGSQATWTLGSDGVLTVRGVGSVRQPYEYEEERFSQWESLQKKVRAVVVEEGITVLGWNMFSGFSEMGSVSLPISLEVIGGSCFAGCDSLKELSYPGTREQFLSIRLLEDGNEALTDLYPEYDSSWMGGDSVLCTLNNNGTFTVSGTGPMYDYGMSSNPPWIGGNILSAEFCDGVTSVGSLAFNGVGWTFELESLKQVSIADSVTRIGRGAFAGCSSLEEITIPKNVSFIGERAFYRCYGLKKITVAPENTDFVCDASGVLFSKDMKRLIAFPCAAGVTSYEIPEGTETIEAGAFYGAAALKTVHIPDTVTQIGEHAFDNTALYKDEANWQNGVLYIDNACIAAKRELSGDYAVKDGTVCIADRAFALRESMTSVTLPKSLAAVGYGAFANCTGVKAVHISDLAAWCLIAFGGYESNPLSGARLYLNGEEITALTIPDGVTEIGNYAFEGCVGLTSVTIPDGVTHIENDAFSRCEGLTSVAIPDSVKTIEDYAFGHCGALKTVNGAGGVTYIGDDAFAASITFTDDGETIEHSFLEESNWAGDALYLGHVLLAVKKDAAGPELRVAEGTTYIASQAAKGCEGIRTVTLPDSVERVGYEAFTGTGFYNDPANWDNGLLYLGRHLLDSQRAVSGAVEIRPGTVSISDSALGWREDLTSCTIPDSVRFIGESALIGCPKMKSVYLSGNMEEIGAAAFSYRMFGADTSNNPSFIIYSDRADSAAARYAERVNTQFRLLPLRSEGQTLFTASGVTVKEIQVYAGPSAKVTKASNAAADDAMLCSGMTLERANGEQQTVVIKGDNTGDGKIGSDDARLALRRSVSLEEFTDWQTAATLMGSEKKVSAADARLILRASVGLEKLQLA